MGMDSQKLSARLRQPGHDRTFRESEENFIRAARECLDPDVYDVVPSPDDLKGIFKGVEGARDLGVRPEAAIVNKRTGRRFFVEVKKQGPRGNAEERAAKHHTVQFYKTLKSAFGYDFHPYVTVFCDHLATDARYTTKFPYLYEPDHYLLWVDYDLELVCLFLRERCAAWLDDD
jgi:hypothetical protein